MNLSPEHLHVALNHLPIIGLPMAAFVLVVGLWRQTKQTQVLGLILALISAGSIPVLMNSGEEAYGNLVSEPTLDQTGKHWMNVHGARAEKISKILYLDAALAGLGLIAAWKRPSWLWTIAGMVFILSLCGSAGSVWVAEAGGKIRHSEFR